MVNLFKKIKTTLNYCKVSYHLFKFAFKLGTLKENEARTLIIQSRWRVNQFSDEKSKTFLLDFIDTMEKGRFPNDK